MKLFNNALPCLLVLICVSFVPHSIFAQTPKQAPAVVWDFHSTTGQNGWNGLSDPNARKADRTFTKGIDNGSGGYSVGQAYGGWQGSWSLPDATWNVEPTAGFMNGVFDSRSIRVDLGVGATWRSQFSLEDAVSSLSAEAWVRGAPGTAYEVSVHHEGEFRAVDRFNYGGGFEINRDNFGFAGPRDLRLELDQINDTLVLASGNETRVFDEYPDVVYSRVSFRDEPFSYLEESSVRASSGRTCILACGEDFRLIEGQALLSSSLAINLLTDDTIPTIEDITSSLSGPILEVGETIDFGVIAYDPSDGNAPGDGIVHYNFFANDELISINESGNFSYVVENTGNLDFRFAAVDDEGAIGFQTLQFTAVPEPSGFLGVFLGLSCLVAKRRR